MKTIDDVLALDFGYVTGNDLVAYCPQEFLINKLNATQEAFQVWVKAAKDEVLAMMSASLDLDNEFAKTGTDRNGYILKLVVISFVQNITATVMVLPENLKDLLSWYVKECDQIRKSQRSTTSVQNANEAKYQTAKVVQQIFGTIGG